MSARKGGTHIVGGWGPFHDSDEKAELKLEEYRARYGAGDTAALLEAVEYCLWNRAPQWVRRGFCDRLGRWQALLVSTLDEAFGLHKIKHQRAKFERQQIMFEVYGAVQAAERLGIGKSEWVFEVIGEELGISTGRVKKYLVAARNDLKAQFEMGKRGNPKAKIFATTFGTRAKLQERLARLLLAERDNRRQKT